MKTLILMAAALAAIQGHASSLEGHWIAIQHACVSATDKSNSDYVPGRDKVELDVTGKLAMFTATVADETVLTPFIVSPIEHFMTAEVDGSTGFYEFEADNVLTVINHSLKIAGTCNGREFLTFVREEPKP